MSFIAQPAANLHSPTAIGDVTPNTVAASALTVLDGLGSHIDLDSNGFITNFGGGSLELNTAGPSIDIFQGVLTLGGTTTGGTRILNSSGKAQVKLGDASAFAQIQGKLTTDVNATTGLGAGLLAATTNATVVIYDGSGQAYRVPCII